MLFSLNRHCDGSLSPYHYLLIFFSSSWPLFFFFSLPLNSIWGGYGIYIYIYTPYIKKSNLTCLFHYTTFVMGPNKMQDDITAPYPYFIVFFSSSWFFFSFPWTQFEVDLVLDCQSLVIFHDIFFFLFWISALNTGSWFLY